jgi:hypothetical protein
MSYSRIHKHFADNLIRHFPREDVLDDPMTFLGPNYETVLNFWKWLDSLTVDQREIVHSRNKLSRSDRNQADTIAMMSAYYVIGEEFAKQACLAAGSGPFGFATYELIGMHLLLEQGNKLTFVPMFDGL